MNMQVVQEVCYLEESGSDRDIPPDYQAMDVLSTAKPGRLAGWLGRQPGKKRGADLPSADGSRVGVRLPCGKHWALVLWR